MVILELFSQSGTASSMLFLAIASILGILLGKIKIGNIKLGIAGVLFSGLLLGHLGAQMDDHVLHFVKEFGLILFVYSIGISIGPRFISSFKDNGLKINMLAALIVFLGFGIAITLKFIFNLEVQEIAGILCGAVTNTPSLGAAQTVLTEQLQDGTALTEVSGMGYAVAYPFGILGIIIVMALVRWFFKIKIKNEVEQYKIESTGVSGKVRTVKVTVTNPNLEGKNMKFLRTTLDKELVISRLFRNDNFMIINDELSIEQGDVLYGICTPENIPQLELKIGRVNVSEKFEITGLLSMRHVSITNRKIAGHKIHDINLPSIYPANITRIFRGDTEIIPSLDTTIEFGDTVRIVGVRDKMQEVAEFLGNSLRDLSHPNLVPLFIGIFLGIILGSIPIFLPGLPAPAKLGLAGGPLIIALILGHKGRIGSFDFYMTPSANLYIRELGIVLFLACVGLGSGKNFWSTIVNGGYMWMLYGAIITFVPLLIVGVLARWLKLNYLVICGILSGAMTDPPALEFANSIAPGQAQSTAYATVYPFTMFLRILVAQILVLMFI